ncbi:MAG TPA: protein kinase [Ignavibacteriaceae bacterium]|nr:protein kinase [Ignavibacteriaceae bacterium]
MIGEIILHYKIIEKLGEGGMGVVYLAEDTKLRRRVAIKFLPRNIAADTEERKRFEIEAQAAASLNHPNITTIHAIEESDDTIFIVMEFIDGIELKEKIKASALSQEEKIQYAIQISDGLSAAHKKGIVHRDIKSSNIMITNDGIAKIMDFGLAKIGKGSQVTKLGTTIGTIAYMSPEQTRGETLDHRTDIWSFGIVLYEMLTGTQPFKGAYDQAIIYSILNEEPEINNIPEEFSHILMRALAKSPSDRYQKTSDMLSDLKSLKGDSISKSSSGITNVSKPDNSKMKLWIGIAAILIIAAISIFYFITNKNEEQVTQTPGKEMIVVMPFENLGSQDDKYFADGVTDEITSKLASIGNIGVISTSSAEKLAKSNKSTQEIGKELRVNYILSGTIRWAKSGKNQSRVRITPQLIRVSDNTITWSDSYDRVLNDIFAVQNEIAQKVVNQLGGTLANNKIQKETPPTDNFAAYDYYLQALAYFKRGNAIKSDILNCISLNKKAIELDPKFALAYALLAKGQMSMYWFYFDRSSENLQEAFENAQKSFQLNPGLAEAHLALGYYYYWGKLNYSKAIEEFSKALNIQPNNAEAYASTGYVYRRMGNFKLATQNMVKGSTLDPLSSEYSYNTAETYSLLRDYQNADKYYKLSKDFNPDYLSAKTGLALNYINWKGDTKKASDEINNIKKGNYLNSTFDVRTFINVLDRDYDQAIQSLKTSGITYWTEQFRYMPDDLELAFIYRYKKLPDLSKKYFESSKYELEKMLKDSPNDERLHSSLGITFAGLGLKDKAIAEGKKGIELLPLEKEAYRGYYRQWDMAIIYTLLGDNDNALKQIDFILSIPGSFSVNGLKMDPLYDSLRNLSGYKTIIEKYK